jgi:cytochrome b
VWGSLSRGYGSFERLSLGSDDFALHFSHLKNRYIPAQTGHNPLGWLMIVVTWLLFIGLASTGFMLEEVDYFFGDSLVEDIHSILSDVLFGFVLLHIIAVVFVAWWVKISLVLPMITGKRKP